MKLEKKKVVNKHITLLILIIILNTSLNLKTIRLYFMNILECLSVNLALIYIYIYICTEHYVTRKLTVLSQQAPTRSVSKRDGARQNG
jgi:hypothetical protein